MNLKRAIEIAKQAHSGQVDEAGKPYALHPMRVRLTMKTRAEKIVAVLHDVVEQTDWTLDQLRAEGFSEEIIHAIDALTRKASEKTYKSFIRRIAKNKIATKVKIADIKDNLQPFRYRDPISLNDDWVIEYYEALNYLNSSKQM